MHADKILFPTDFSPASEHALRWATSLARDSGATISIIHVEEPPMAYGGGEMYVGFDDASTKEELRRTLVQITPTDHNVAYDHKLLVGNPADAIVHEAEVENADLIVMGTHGRTGLTRLLMGSVAEAVVRRAKCPVLTVKQPAEVPAHA
jgi:universal stress protein A